MKNLNDINVLMLGTGGEPLLEETTSCNEFVQYRHKQYAERIHSLHIAVKTLKDGRLKPRKLSEKLYTYPTLSRNNWLGVIDLYRLCAKIIKGKDIDVIVASDPFGAGLVGYMLKLRYKKPLCLQMFADYAFNPIWQHENLHQCLVSKLARFIFKRADSIRVISEQLKHIIIKELAISPDRIFTYHIFVNRKQFLQHQGSDIRSRLLGQNYENIILTIGRLVPQKDLFTLLKAAQSILEYYPKTLFLILGNGEEKYRLQQYASICGIDKNVSLFGYVPYSDIPKYYAACDIFALSSAYEDTARVLIEAALSAKPIVTTETVGARDVVKDGQTGFIVPIKKPSVLAERILRLLSERSLRDSFGQAGRQHVQNMFDEDSLIKGIVTMWHKTTCLYHKKS